MQLIKSSKKEASLKKLPKMDNALLLRTDFSDDAAWAALCEAVQEPSEDGFTAYVDCISDPDYSEFADSVDPDGIFRGFP